MYNKLCDYKKKHQHVRIPAIVKEYNRLLYWTYAQRKSYKDAKLSPEQIKKLNDLGFSW